jgi:hypothetical protein
MADDSIVTVRATSDTTTAKRGWFRRAASATWQGFVYLGQEQALAAGVPLDKVLTDEQLERMATPEDMAG